MLSTLAVEAAYAALVQNDFATALRIVRDAAEIDPEASASTLPAPNADAADVTKTIYAPPTKRQRERWRYSANRRVSGVVVKPPVVECCPGIYFHANDCHRLDPTTRYATTPATPTKAVKS